MPRSVFLDASGWIALLNAREQLHATAVRQWRALAREGRRLVLTEWVMAETGNGLAHTQARFSFATAAKQVLVSPSVQVVPVTTNLVLRALELYASRSDKTWGLVDCASFVVMADHGIVEAFTTDRHFEQAGFTCLLPLTLGE